MKFRGRDGFRVFCGINFRRFDQNPQKFGAFKVISSVDQNILRPEVDLFDVRAKLSPGANSPDELKFVG